MQVQSVKLTFPSETRKTSLNCKGIAVFFCFQSQITKIQMEVSSSTSSSSSSERNLQLKISELLTLLEKRQTTITHQEEVSCTRPVQPFTLIPQRAGKLSCQPLRCFSGDAVRSPASHFSSSSRSNLMNFILKPFNTNVKHGCFIVKKKTSTKTVNFR